MGRCVKILLLSPAIFLFSPNGLTRLCTVYPGEQLESMDYDGESALSSVTWVDEAAQIGDKKEMHKILFASTLITSGMDLDCMWCLA